MELAVFIVAPVELVVVALLYLLLDPAAGFFGYATTFSYYCYSSYGYYCYWDDESLLALVFKVGIVFVDSAAVPLAAAAVAAAARAI